MDDDSRPLTQVCNILRAHPSLQLAGTSWEVTRDKLMASPVIRAWAKELRPHHAEKAWRRLIDDGCNLLERDRVRAAYHLATVDLSSFTESDRQTAFAILKGHAIAGLLVGMQSKMSVRLVAAACGHSKQKVSRYRRLLMDCGALEGTLGRPNKHPEGGETARILFPLPAPRPGWFKADEWLADLTDEERARMELEMNTSRLQRLTSVDPDELSTKGKRALGRVRRVVSAPTIPPTPLNPSKSTIQPSYSFGVVDSPQGLADEVQRTSTTVDPAERQAFIDQMRELHFAPWEVAARLRQRRWD